MPTLMADDDSLPQRVAALEAQLKALHREVAVLRERLQDDRTPVAADHAAPAAPAVAPAAQPTPASLRSPRLRPAVKADRDRAADRIGRVLRSQDWLGKIGIGLLLFGLAFLFKYSIDKGWLGPPVRVGFGVALGALLLGIGLRLRPDRKSFGQVLLGGSIATFYVTIFAAFQLYNLVAYPLAFVAMAAVTLMAFVLAVRQNDAVLAVVAMLGGLGTPFLLYTGAGSLPGLVGYTCAVLASGIGVYIFRGWRSLLLTAVVGGWLVFWIGWAEVAFQDHSQSDEVAFLLGVVFCMIAFGMIPTARAVARLRQPNRWPMPAVRFFEGRSFAEQPALVPAFVAPLMTWMLSAEVLDASDEVMGLLLIGLALVYAGASVWLRRVPLPALASAHASAAAALVMVACFYLLDGVSLRLVALATEAVALHLLARRLEDQGLRFFGHALFIGLAMALAVRLLEEQGLAPALVNTRAAADAIVLAMGFGAAWTLHSAKGRTVYVLLAYLGLLGWFWRDLVVLSNGQAYVSMAWGLCAIGLLALGWWRDADLPRQMGLSTLLVVVAKLFVIDLDQLEAIWRILLFLGFGGLLLLLSYFFPSLWRPGAEDEAQEERAEAGDVPE